MKESTDKALEVWLGVIERLVGVGVNVYLEEVAPYEEIFPATSVNLTS